MWSSSRRAICSSNDTHIAHFAARSQSCAAGDFERQGAMQIRLICGAAPKVAGAAGPIRFPTAPIIQTVNPRQ
jgi:hypothetical protein